MNDSDKCLIEDYLPIADISAGVYAYSGILAALLVRPDKTWYASELARRMAVTVGTGQS